MALRSSFCTIAFRNTDTEPVEIFQQLKHCGYQGAEVWGDHVEDMDEGHLEHTASAAKQIGIALPVVSFYVGLFNLPMNNMEEQINIAQKAVHTARVMNIPKIRSFAGWTCECSSLTASEEYWEFVLEGFNRIGRIIDRANTDLVLETHSDCMADSLQGVKRLAEAADTPRFKVNLQCGAFEKNSGLKTPVESYLALESLGIPVAHMHMPAELTDAKEEFRYKELFRTMDNNGFDGYISIEHCSGKGDPLDAARNGIALQKKLFP